MWIERHLENTIWNNVNRISERADELIELHSKFIRNVKNKMNANEIAERLFEYEKNMLFRK